MRFGLRRRTIDQAFNDRGCLKEFCEHTSLVGFKYLLPEYGSLTRRFFWAAVCLTFTFITLYQLAQQIQGYINSPLTVTIHKQYPNALEFPRVVICNSMQYRISKVGPESNMHHAFGEMFQIPNLNLNKTLEYKEVLSKITDTKQYLTEIAFDKEDMIIMCVWKADEPCTAANFSIEIVDSQICYSFNTGENGTRMIANAGDAYGLHLALNIETYERMQGPYTTLGAMISFQPRNHPSTLQGAVNTMTGTNTKIGLRQNQIQYYPGETCNDKRLKYFSRYSRSYCMLENKMQAVVNECGCLPYILNETQAFGNVSNCNLFQHFSCAFNKLGEAQTTFSEDCPKECDVISYDVSVSQSRIAWDQAESALKGFYAPRIHLQEKLLNTSEIRKRYKTENNRSTIELFSNFREASQNVTNLMASVNNISFCDNISQQPKWSSIAESLNAMERLLFYGENALMQKSYKYLSLINDGINDISNICSTASFLKYLSLPINANESESVEHWDFDQQLFFASKDIVYVNTLYKWTEIYDIMKKTQDDFGNSLAMISHDWKLILHENEFRFFNEILDKIISMGKSPRCYDINLTTGEQYSNNSDNYLLSDLITCFIYQYSSDDAKLISVSSMINTVSNFNTSHGATELQARMCSKLLCQSVEELYTCNCSLKPKKLLDFIANATNILKDRLMECHNQLRNAESDIIKFISNYRNNTLAKFNEFSSEFDKHLIDANNLRIMLDQPIWQHDARLEEIEKLLIDYIQGNITYKELATSVTGNHASFLKSGFQFSVNQARLKMTSAAEGFERLQTYVTYFNTDLEISTKTHGTEIKIRQLVSNQINISKDNFKNILTCYTDTQHIAMAFLRELSHREMSYIHQSSLLIKSCELYLSDLDINVEFFDKNFMVVSVFFQDISNDLIIQTSSYNFWSLMSDIGGASGLWLGFCLVTLVELFEMLFRRSCCYAGSLIYTKNKRKISGVVQKISNLSNGVNLSHGLKGNNKSSFDEATNKFASGKITTVSHPDRNGIIRIKL